VIGDDGRQRPAGGVRPPRHVFSPDGRIYQVEYAREAVSRGAPSVGVRTADGVVFVAMSRPSSTLMEAESIEKLHKLDDHLGTASAGHVADAPAS